MKTNAIIGRVKPVLSAMAAAVLLAACAAPEFKQPQIDTPTAFKEAQAPAVQTAADGTLEAGRAGRAPGARRMVAGV